MSLAVAGFSSLSLLQVSAIIEPWLAESAGPRRRSLPAAKESLSGAFIIFAPHRFY
jgi:hypothetical protein